MQRLTFSLDDALALQFDAFIAAKGYVNRSEAVRDLIRSRIDSATLDTPPGGQKTADWCVANVSFVYDHRELSITTRVLDLQHNHHDLVITSVHTYLDHDNCLETVVLRGPLPAVRACADQLVALRGVRHGNIHLVPLDASGSAHVHLHVHGHEHVHLKPIN
jgi:CopG family nickel-responsive transcriptional regulator